MLRNFLNSKIVFFSTVSVALIILGCISAVYVWAAAFNILFLFPDELYLFHVYEIHGYFGAIRHYWEDLTIGRISAMGLGFLEVMLTDYLLPSPWWGTVFFRGLNNLLMVVVVYICFRRAIPTLPRYLIFAIAILFYASANSLNDPSTGHFMAIWLLDQVNYYFLAAAYFFVFSYLCIYLRSGFNRSNEFVFALWFFLFLNAHEIALVVGGLILFIMFLLSVARPLRRGSTLPGILQQQRDVRFQQTQNRPYPVTATDYICCFTEGILSAGKTIRAIFASGIATRSRFALAFYGVIFCISAAIHLSAPGLSTRDKIWPKSMPFLPDSFLSGFNAGVSTFERMIDFSPPIAPILFLVSLVSGFVFSPVINSKTRRYYYQISGLAIFFVIVFSFTISSLMAYTGRIGSYFPPHQLVFFAFLSLHLTALLGFFTGSILRSDEIRFRHKLLPWPVIATASVVIYISPIHRGTVTFLQGESVVTHVHPRPNHHVKFQRTELQLRTVTAGKKAFVDEIPLFTPKSPRTTIEFFHGNAFGLAPVYGLNDIIYIPCELGPKPKLCNGQGRRPMHKRIVFDKPSDYKTKWGRPTHVRVDLGGNGILIRETPARGEHYLLGGPFKRGEQSAVHVEVEILERRNLKKFAL